MKKIILMLMLLAPMSMYAQKFGHLDADAVMQSMPEAIKAQGELKQLAAQYEADLKAMQSELQRKAEEYEKNMATMNETKKKETEASLQEMYNKIQQTAADNQNAFAKAQQEKLEPIQVKLMNAIKNVGKNGGYVYIMQTGQTLYISDTLSKDITADVKAEVAKMK